MKLTYPKAISPMYAPHLIRIICLTLGISFGFSLDSLAVTLKTALPQKMERERVHQERRR